MLIADTELLLRLPGLNPPSVVSATRRAARCSLECVRVATDNTQHQCTVLMDNAGNRAGHFPAPLVSLSFWHFISALTSFPTGHWPFAQ
ncbi:hypothetical protein J6590_038115 [Homalodisca vitripennis]|nr:hypothetical protein J6590_038115 [Homalodisca vitripennis]